MTSRRLAELAGLADGTQARTLVRQLNELYDGATRKGAGAAQASAGVGKNGAGVGKNGAGVGQNSVVDEKRIVGRSMVNAVNVVNTRIGRQSAFRVEEVAGGYQLMTRPCVSPWLRRLHTTPVEVRLSTSALETLAVVAYRQPVMRAELEAIRGVQCGEMLRQLNERDLVRIVGRSPELGRPFLYGTTKKFLQVFGLRSLEALPRAEQLRRDAVANPVESAFSNVSNPHSDTLQESPVKIAILPHAPDDLQDELLTFPSAELIDRQVMDPRADEDMEDDDDEEDEDDDFDDDDDDDLDEEEWEEVDDEEDEEWEDDEEEDWDDDDDDDWEEEEEEEGEAAE